MTVPLGTQDMGRKILYSYDNTGRQTGMHVVPVDLTTLGQTSQTALNATTAVSLLRHQPVSDPLLTRCQFGAEAVGPMEAVAGDTDP